MDYLAYSMTELCHSSRMEVCSNGLLYPYGKSMSVGKIGMQNGSVFQRIIVSIMGKNVSR